MYRESVLKPIYEQVLAIKDLETAKQLILETLEKAPIQDQHIKLMKVQVKYQIHTKQRLDKFVINMLLAKQGLQVI